MKKAVMYGAGNIGRGFMGQLFYQGGYETVFIDADESIVAAINKEGQYPITMVSGEGRDEIVVKNVRALCGGDRGAIAGEIARCDILSIAVGVGALPKIIPALAEGIRQRSASERELNIIICENKIDADEYIKSLVCNFLPRHYRDYIENKVGFIRASVGRMVPALTGEMKDENILRVLTEPFCELYVDRDAFKGETPKIPGIFPETGFLFHIEKKLFVHNMGHSLAAYLGRLKGYEYIFEAVLDEDIRKIVKNAMLSSAKALAAEHKKSLAPIKKHVLDLLGRFENRHLGDTVLRVGRDVGRKLGENDRFQGAIKLCDKHGVDSFYIKLGVGAALLFGESYDIDRLRGVII